MKRKHNANHMIIIMTLSPLKLSKHTGTSRRKNGIYFVCIHIDSLLWLCIQSKPNHPPHQRVQVKVRVPFLLQYSFLNTPFIFVLHWCIFGFPVQILTSCIKIACPRKLRAKQDKWRVIPTYSTTVHVHSVNKTRQSKAATPEDNFILFSRENEELPQAEFEPATFCVLGRHSTNGATKAVQLGSWILKV